jgi:hypothetical protein
METRPDGKRHFSGEAPFADQRVAAGGERFLVVAGWMSETSLDRQ